MPGSSTRSGGKLVLLVAVTVLTAGCALYEGSSGEDPPPEGVRQGEECNVEPVQDDRSSGAQVSCLNAQGGDRHEQTFDCPDPSRSAVSLAANLSAGSLTIAVQDADTSVVFRESYDQQGEFEDKQDIDEGTAGEWVLTVDRSEGLEGAFGIRAACAK